MIQRAIESRATRHVTTFASLPMGDVPVLVPVEANLAVVAVSAERVVPAHETDTTRFVSGDLVQLLSEAALPGMAVTLAGFMYAECGNRD